MKVALIYDCLYPYNIGGGEHRNYAIAKALTGRHDIAFYSFHHWAKDESRCLPHCRYVACGKPVPFTDAKGNRRISEAIRFAWGLIPALLRSQEDLWDVTNFPYFSVLVARFISLIKRKAMIVTWHEYCGDALYQYFGWKGIFARAVETLTLWCSPRIIASSHFTRQRLILAGYPKEKIFEIPIGIDQAAISRIPPAPESADLVYIGRLEPHKQIGLLIRSLKILRETHPQARLWVIGEGSQQDALKELARQLALQEDIRFFGTIPSENEVYARLKSSRVLVLPSKREGFGMSVIEAWACGIPVVVCDEPHSALPELVDSPIKGRVVRSDPHAIAAACSELLSLPKEFFLEKLTRAVEPYDWQTIGADLELVYEKALKKRCEVSCHGH